MGNLIIEFVNNYISHHNEGIVLEEKFKDSFAKLWGLLFVTTSAFSALFAHQSSAVRSILVTSLLPYFFIPLPFKIQQGNLLFASITKHQATYLNALFLTSESKMCAKHLINYSSKNTNKWIWELCGNVSFFVSSSWQQRIVSIVLSNSTQRDYDIESFFVLRGYHWCIKLYFPPYVKSLFV